MLYSQGLGFSIQRAYFTTDTVRPYNPKSPTSQRPRPSTLCIEFDGSPPSYFARCCGSPDICSAKQQPNPFCFGILFPDKKDESLKVDDIALCQTDSLFVENRTAKLKILFIKNVTQCGSNILRFYVTRSHLKDNFTVCDVEIPWRKYSPGTLAGHNSPPSLSSPTSPVNPKSPPSGRDPLKILLNGHPFQIDNYDYNDGILRLDIPGYKIVPVNDMMESDTKDDSILQSVSPFQELSYTTASSKLSATTTTTALWLEGDSLTQDDLMSIQMDNLLSLPQEITWDPQATAAADRMMVDYDTLYLSPDLDTSLSIQFGGSFFPSSYMAPPPPHSQSDLSTLSQSDQSTFLTKRKSGSIGPSGRGSAPAGRGSPRAPPARVPSPSPSPKLQATSSSFGSPLPYSSTTPTTNKPTTTTSSSSTWTLPRSPSSSFGAGGGGGFNGSGGAPPARPLSPEPSRQQPQQQPLLQAPLSASSAPGTRRGRGGSGVEGRSPRGSGPPPPPAASPRLGSSSPAPPPPGIAPPGPPPPSPPPADSPPPRPIQTRRSSFSLDMEPAGPWFVARLRARGNRQGGTTKPKDKTGISKRHKDKSPREAWQFITKEVHQSPSVVRSAINKLQIVVTSEARGVVVEVVSLYLLDSRRVTAATCKPKFFKHIPKTGMKKIKLPSIPPGCVKVLILVSAKAEQEPSMPNTLTQFTLEVEESDSEILDKRVASFLNLN